MKRVTIAVRTPDGTIKEQNVFVDTLNEAKQVENFLAIISHGRIKHPSPEVMQCALKSCNMNLHEFYMLCDSIKSCLDNPDIADNVENSDANIPASNQPKNRR